MKRLSMAILTVATMGLGCPGNIYVIDSAAEDSGTGSQPGTKLDSGVGSDANVSVNDGGGATDTGVGTDGGVGQDATAGPDGSTTTHDTGVIVDNGFQETFSNGGAEDNPGWQRSTGWTIGAEDHSGVAGSMSLSGLATSDSFTPVVETTTLNVELGTAPKLSFWRKVDLNSPAYYFRASFTVAVDGEVVDEAVATTTDMVDQNWVEVADIDLSAYEEQEVIVTFEVSAASWGWLQDAKASVLVDDIRIDQAGTPPPPTDAGTSPTDAGTPPPPQGAPYPHASEQANDLVEVFNETGPFGVAVTGGHLLAGNSSGASTFPRETPLSSSSSVDIPQGAQIRYAFLWYTGVLFQKPHTDGAGDYTADLGGPLDNRGHVEQNGLTFQINGNTHGPFDTSSRQPPNPSAIGSDTHISPRNYAPVFGTLTGVNESVWGNRLDVTGLVSGLSGNITVSVDPPERLDVNGNNASSNGGNPAGNTNYNLCTSGSSWSLMVVYERSDLPQKNIVLMDGPFARAWDYMFFHTGEWRRPKVRINHEPIQPGARFVVYAPSGSPGGAPIPTNPACSCGCGGEYTLKNSSGPYGRNAFFSDTLEDPAACVSDPMHRDRTNGPWYLHSTGFSGRTGNDWTLFQSGAVYTEFPNLYEGEEAPAADSTQPETNEDDPNPVNDTYGGHPWAGRGAVTYHAHGNGMSLVEVALDPSRITTGEQSSFLYFKADQKDVWKPQAVVSVKYILFETPAP